MSGFKVVQALPHPEADQYSPFILLHYAKNELPGGGRPEELGVPPHPHCGFSPVTIIYDGAVHHRDSMGNSSIVRKGGIQWLNAGKGMIHSERPTKDDAEKGGKQEIIQLWINTPQKFKSNDPEYFAFEEEELPNLNLGKASISIIAGEFNGQKSPVKTYSDMTIMNLESKAETNFKIKLNKNFQSAIFVLKGEISINGASISDKEMLLNIENDVEISSIKETKALILSGKPIEEPIVTYGPFVANYEAEIKQAMLNYQNGKFGQINEKFE